MFDCQKVLSSGVGNIFSFTNLSEMAVLYFTFSTFYILSAAASMNAESKLAFLACLNLSGLPVIFYSLINQVFRIKAFCLFCLTIAAIYFLQTVLFLFNYKMLINELGHLVQPALFLAIGFTGMVKLMSDELKKLWSKKSQEADKMNSWFINTPGIFKLLIENQKAVPVAMPAPGKLETGDLSSGNTLAYVINPNCLHCKNLAQEIDRLVFSGKNLAKLKLIFFAEKETAVFLIGVSLAYGGEAAWKAYLLYAREGFISLQKAYSVSKGLLLQAEPVYDEYVNWCRQMKIQTAPKLLINGIMVPDILLNSNDRVKLIENYLLLKQ